VIQKRDRNGMFTTSIWSKIERGLVTPRGPRHKRNEKRNVTLDSNVLISYVISKRDNTVTRKVVTKSVTDDRLMLTDVILEECITFADKPKGKKLGLTKEKIDSELNELSKNIINISPVPSEEELKRKYRIRDRGDLKILYSVEMTDSVILVTWDDDFTDVKGLKAKIMKPPEYLNESKKKHKRRQ